ncbi:serrate RNA effector molecule-like [Hordeum vulgare subsp. vulgare]|uniref:C2H2-type domain-containing protein n=1 Tax=Hordeum vulgare subsp. vulgare TaxID=112509 RepID=A0A8I6YZV8_HORVV|nr:serrate RNA effector molecule-like [Hordeum vulgare subsp. vulgare]
MTYKQFILALEDDISPAEAESRYQEYKTAYITTQKRAYFDLHKDDTRLKEKYHPTSLLSVIERRNEFCKAAAKSLILDLRSGTLDLGPGMTADGSRKSGNDNNGSSGNGEDYGDKRRKNGRGPPKESGRLSTAPKAHPVSSKYRRIQTDIDQTLALVRKLDSEKGIVGNILSSGGDHGKPDDDRSLTESAGPIVIVRGLTTVKGLDGVELLDTLLTYLWRVHGVDYYGMAERRDANGFRHVRADNKIADAFNISAADWEKKLDSFWHERLVNGEDPLVVLTAKDKTDAATVEALAPYVKKILDQNYGYKYRCGAMGCAKVFHAPEFVHKHLKLKHPDLVSVLTLRVQDDIYFQNYMNDPNAPGGRPVMQQPEQDNGGMRRIPDKMLGAFDEQGSQAPFVPDALPPLLVPVPGAGLLGPFVPIPPGMAVQMMREQRPPRPNGAQLRKKPLMPEPMMPMYPHFPLDPRPLRKYHDLDAPEEEVAVIDYRSV